MGAGGIFNGAGLGSLGATDCASFIQTCAQICADGPTSASCVECLKNPCVSGNTQIGASKALACASKEAIEAVQSLIGATPDGKWGPQSQAALERSGKSFKQWINCSGNAPGGTTTGTGPATVATTNAMPQPYGQPAQASMFSAEIFSKPIFWVGAAMVAVGSVILLKSKKRAKKNGRKHHRNCK